MSKDYISQLTGVRIFLTIMVVISNMVLFKDVDPGFVRESNWFVFNMFASAPIRVDIFFMLTGFLLFYVYRTKFSEEITYKSYTKFFLIRLARIYPVHLLTLVIIGIFYLFGIWQSIGDSSVERVTRGGNWFLNLTLLNAWGISEQNVSWNGPAWSISAEFFNYILFPVVAILIVNIKRFKVQIVSVLGVLLVYEYLQFTVIQDLNTYKGTPALFRAFVGMVLGMLLAQIYISKKLENWPWDSIALAMIFALTVSMVLLTMHLYDVKERPPTYLFFYMPLPILVMAIASSKHYMKSFFSLPFLVYLGNLSFCIYMLHQPVTRLFYYAFNEYYEKMVAEQNNWIIGANLCVVLLTIILISAVVYRYIEVPLRTWLKNKIVS